MGTEADAPRAAGYDIWDSSKRDDDPLLCPELKDAQHLQ